MFVHFGTERYARRTWRRVPATGVLDRRDVLDFMHGRSRVAVDPRIPTMPGRGVSGFHRPGTDTSCTKREGKREVSGETHEGWAASYEEPILRRSFLRLGDSFNELIKISV